MDYKKAAQEIMEASGGTENIKSIAHCATRLRLTLRDRSMADMEAIKKIEGVLGVVYAAEQLQVILGKNLIPIFNEITSTYNVETGENVKENLDQELVGKSGEKLSVNGIFQKMLGYIVSSVSAQTPGLIAGGMLKVLLMLSILAFPSFENNQTYALLSILADVPFYFMPIFIAYGASKKLGSTPIYSLILSAALIAPGFVELIGGDVAYQMLGFLPVRLVRYSSTLFPALLVTLLAWQVEKLLNKIIPSVLRTTLVGVGTLVISYTLGITLLAPLGSYIGVYLARLFIWLGTYVGPIAVCALAAALPFLVMTGTHTAIAPLMTQSIADPGYDKIFRPAFMMHNMAEGGACFGVGLRTKNAEFRTECFSMAFSCMVAGVTEPAIYGINLRLKKPIIAASIGGACGGLTAGLLGATAYQAGYSTLLALPIFQGTVIAAIAGVIVTFLVSSVAAFLLGFEEGADRPAA